MFGTDSEGFIQNITNATITSTTYNIHYVSISNTLPLGEAITRDVCVTQCLSYTVAHVSST